jgi:predicted Zn-dependent peptidase
MLDRLEDAEALARRIAKVTAGDLLRVASTYLVASRSTLGWFLPAGKEAEETGAEDGEGRA